MKFPWRNPMTQSPITPYSHALLGQSLTSSAQAQVSYHPPNHDIRIECVEDGGYIISEVDMSGEMRGSQPYSRQVAVNLEGLLDVIKLTLVKRKLG